MAREMLSVVVTTLDNAATLERCLASAAFADDIVVLDSGSSDATVEIAAKYKARVFSEPFKGYAAQKQSAIDKAAHAWVLLLDADEEVTAVARPLIERALQRAASAQPHVAGFRLPRREQMFWTFQHALSWTNTHLRLFDRGRARMNAVPVHAAPDTDGPVRTLRGAVCCTTASRTSVPRWTRSMPIPVAWWRTSCAGASVFSVCACCSIRRCFSCASISSNAIFSTAGLVSSVRRLARSMCS